MRGKPLSLLLPWIKSQHCASEWRTKHPAALNDAHSKQNDEDVLQITKTEFSWNNWHRRSYSHTNCYLEEKKHPYTTDSLDTFDIVDKRVYKTRTAHELFTGFASHRVPYGSMVQHQSAESEDLKLNFCFNSKDRHNS